MNTQGGLQLRTQQIVSGHEAEAPFHTAAEPGQLTLVGRFLPDRTALRMLVAQIIVCYSSPEVRSGRCDENLLPGGLQRDKRAGCCLEGKRESVALEVHEAILILHLQGAARKFRVTGRDIRG